MASDCDNEEKTIRVLDFFERLHKGDIVSKTLEAERYGMTTKTVQRDIQTINKYLLKMYGADSSCNVKYSKPHNGYRMERQKHSWLTGEEILSIAKVLLESRAFSKNEMIILLDKLSIQCAAEECKHIKEVIRNERHHYIPTQHNQMLGEKIWQLSLAVREQRMLTIHYQKEQDKTIVERIVEPQGIIFSEYYFYLIAYIHGKDYEFPAIYRLDRIHEYCVLDAHFRVQQAKRFEEGEFRKRVQFMTSGNLLRIRFKFWGKSLDAVLDRLPTARVLSQDGNIAVVEAEVYGRGIKMWLLSQAEFLEVLEPQELREEMQGTIMGMLKHYL
ncbi:helix-turn-helix transcriptional regulator [Pelosinus sp. sgz500959]|uniref:helix-turn-helix transcriptional regulator n=1 Tax=Pelosinus sp. sgz500959 TaxID=3242472 RepID=UPI0036715A15